MHGRHRRRKGWRRTQDEEVEEVEDEDAIIIDDEDEEEECDMRLMKTKRLRLMMKICENEHSCAARQTYQTYQAEGYVLMPRNTMSSEPRHLIPEMFRLCSDNLSMGRANTTLLFVCRFFW